MLNVELLRKVKFHILDEPQRFMMGRWVISGQPGEQARAMDRGTDGRVRRIPKCGTIACIAGWSCLLGGEDIIANRGDIQNRAQRLLGLNDDEGRSLFWVDRWPPYYKKLWRTAHGLQAKANVAAKRIESFIKSNQQ